MKIIRISLFSIVIAANSIRAQEITPSQDITYADVRRLFSQSQAPAADDLQPGSNWNCVSFPIRDGSHRTETKYVSNYFRFHLLSDGKIVNEFDNADVEPQYKFTERWLEVITRVASNAFWIRVTSNGDLVVLKDHHWSYDPGFLFCPNLFRYNSKTGVCENSRGVLGLNKIPTEVVRQTKNGECSDLKEIELKPEQGHYPKLENWNLKGADLRGSRLLFVHLHNADLRGANLRNFEFGWASLSGLIDRFTQVPEKPWFEVYNCSVNNNQLACVRH
ncbi:MAG: pentapeptide repeat-containing protein [Elusimicrobia bacterium]|nr:pentapeptide repeat-containing protein [Elusimicrobiota bacterium]